VRLQRVQHFHTAALNVLQPGLREQEGMVFHALEPDMFFLARPDPAVDPAGEQIAGSYI
jgi:hypothetical protein